MKKIVIGLVIVTAFLMSGCVEEDGYSLSNMWVGFGVLHETGSESVEIIMDNDDVLIPVASNHSHSWNENRHDDDGESIDLGDRLFLNYTIIGDDVDNEGNLNAYFVKLNSAKKILMKDIIDITPENQDSIGNDPIIVKDYWMNDSLITFSLKYWGYNKMHFINLVKQPGELSDTTSQPIVLELRHNANDDFEEIPYAAYVTFKLNELEINGLDSIQFVVNATDYDGDDFECEGNYVYNNEN